MKSGNPAYGHGALAFLIAVYMFGKFWFARLASSDATILFKMDIVGLFFLSGATLLWLIASLGNIQVIQQFALLGLVVFIFWGAFGFTVFKKLIIPLLIMLTAIPLWDFLNFYLQHITAVGVSFMLSLTTIPFVKEGVQILLQSGTFEIADRCSGLRMVTAIVPVALLYSFQWKFKPWVTLCYVVASVLVAIFANMVRILIVVIAGHLTNMQHFFVTEDHVTLGWIVFGVIVLLFIYLSNKFILDDKWYPQFVTKIENSNSSEEDQNSSIREKYFKNVPASTHTGLLVLGVVGLIVVSGPALAAFFNSAALAPNSEFAIYNKYAQWQKMNSASGQWKPIYQGASLEELVRFNNESGQSLELFLAYYSHQEQGKEAIHYENRIFDPKKWRVDSRRKFSRDIQGAGRIAVTEYKLHALTGQKKLIWQWYYIGGNRTNSTTKTKFYEILAKIKRNPAISVIMLATDIQSSEQEAESTLENFLVNALIPIEKSIDSTS